MKQPKLPVDPPSDLDTETPVDSEAVDKERRRKHGRAVHRIDVNVGYILMYIDDLDINERRKDALRRLSNGVRDAVEEMKHLQENEE